MTKPVANLVQDALEVIYSAFSDDETEQVSSAGVHTLNELGSKLNYLYPVVTSVSITDAQHAGVSELIAAESALSIGSVVRFNKALLTDDLTDDVLATAKGSALALVGDVFILDGADSVEYLGNNSGVAFDFSGETWADLQSIGS